MTGPRVSPLGHAAREMVQGAYSTLAGSAAHGGLPSALTPSGIINATMKGGADLLIETARTEVVFRGARLEVERMRGAFNDLGYARAQVLGFMRDLGQVTGQTTQKLLEATQATLQFNRATGASLESLSALGVTTRLGASASPAAASNRILTAINGNTALLSASNVAMAGLTMQHVQRGFGGSQAFNTDLGLLAAFNDLPNPNYRGEFGARMVGQLRDGTAGMSIGALVTMRRKPGESLMAWRRRMENPTGSEMADIVRFYQRRGEDVGGLLAEADGVARSAHDVQALMGLNPATVASRVGGFHSADALTQLARTGTAPMERNLARVMDKWSDSGEKWVEAASHYMESSKIFDSAVRAFAIAASANVGSSMLGSMLGGLGGAAMLRGGAGVAGRALGGSVGALANPYVLGAVAVGAAGYGLYKYSQHRKEALDSHLSVQSGVDVRAFDLDPIKADLVAAGISATVTSGFRTRQRQQEIYEDYIAGRPDRRTGQRIPLAAKPGNSPHEKGTAIDISLADESDRAQLNEIMARHGWKWHGPSDRVHYDNTTGTPWSDLTRTNTLLQSIDSRLGSAEFFRSQITNPGGKR